MKKNAPAFDAGLDITRIFAFICVVSVHFFRNTGYYNKWYEQPLMYTEVILRDSLVVCVPLFIILTGYLCINKDIELTAASYWKHVKKYFNVFLTWVLCSIAIFAFQLFYLHDYELSEIKYWPITLFGFGGYAWYLDLYFGLIVIIPFLNILWKTAAAQESRKLILAAAVLISIVPSLFNSFDLVTPGAIFTPSLARTITPLFPYNWTAVYPIAYYYLGAYIRCYVDMKKLNSAVLAVLTAGVFLVLGIVSCLFDRLTILTDYDGAFTFIKSGLIFLLINSFRYNFNARVSGVIHYISRLTLPAYLISYIPDSALYLDIRNKEYLEVMRFRYFPETVLKSLVISLALAAVIHALQSGLTAAYRYARAELGGAAFAAAPWTLTMDNIFCPAGLTI